MKITSKRIISMLIVMSIMLAMVGCKGEEAKVSESGEEIHEIIWLTTGDAGANPMEEDDRIIEMINEKFNIDLKVQMVPEGDATKVNVSMASGDLPDIVTGVFGSSATSQWVRDDLLVPLNEYFDVTPTLKETLTGEFSWTAEEDGNFYGYPFIVGYDSSNMTLSFRQDWLDKLGLEVPKTLDDFYDVLLAFRDEDPNETGKDDTYGITTIQPVGDFNFIFYAMGREYADYQLDDEGNVISNYEDESFKKGMEFLRKMYSEGLIDPEFMLNDRTKMEERFYQGRAGYMTAALFRHVSRLEGDLQQVTPEGKLGYSYPPEGEDGSKGFGHMGKTGMFTGVTKDCKAPEKAAQFIDFMVSEEGKELVRLGIEGVHYTKDGDSVVYNEEERAKDNFAENGWAHPLAWGSFEWPLSASFLPETEPSRERALESVEIASEVQMPNLITEIPASEIDKGSMLDSIYHEYFIEMIEGAIDIDTGVEELSTKWREQGGNEILAEVQEIYESQK